MAVRRTPAEQAAEATAEVLAKIRDFPAPHDQLGPASMS